MAAKLSESVLVYYYDSETSLVSFAVGQSVFEFIGVAQDRYFAKDLAERHADEHGRVGKVKIATWAATRGATPLTLSSRQMHSQALGFACNEERTAKLGWHFAMVGGTHRDADTIIESNHLVLQARLAKVDPDMRAHDTLRVGHWGVGWVEHLIVDPTNAEVMGVLAQAREQIDIYPLLDEHHHSALEWDRHDARACDSSGRPQT